MYVPVQGLEVLVLLLFASVFLLLIMLLLLLYTYHLFSDYLVGIVNIVQSEIFLLIMSF